MIYTVILECSECALVTRGCRVNYFALFGLAASLRMGLPVSIMRFADTEWVSVGSAVSAGLIRSEPLLCR